MSAHIPSIEEIERAGSVVRSVARETPLLESRTLSNLTGAQVLIKVEAYSSGNFAQGLAFCAGSRSCGLSARDTGYHRHAR